MKAARDTPKRATKSVRPEGQAFRGNSRLPTLVEWPPASGDYERDCITGGKTALTFLASLEASGGDGSGAALRNMILGMPRDWDRWTGIHVGFCSMLEIAAASGRHRAQETSDYWAG
jgi:hypothetical protein